VALSEDRKAYASVMALIGSAHGMSHFYLLALPPLFPLLKAEFDVSYTALGLLMTLFNTVTGFTQVPAGFLVDRIGARRVLVMGLVTSGIGLILIGLATEYWMILALVLLLGIGNSVFHPADYAILGASIKPERAGRAYALHTFSGNVGFMLAPPVMILLSSLWNWRVAVVLGGLAGFVVVAALIRYGGRLTDESAISRSKGQDTGTAPANGFRSLLTPAIFTMFLFFTFIAMVTSGIQTFSVTALVDYQRIGLASANTVLTGFLVASAAGILLGGPLADKIRRHGLVAAIAMITSAAVLLVVGNVQMPVVALILALVLVGLMQGAVRPSRDMMVRAVAPEGASGRVFSIVMTGLNVGAAVTPVLFGYLIDLGQARWTFLLLTGILILAAGTIGIARSRPTAPAAAE
jgi:MFS family permease